MMMICVPSPPSLQKSKGVTELKRAKVLGLDSTHLFSGGEGSGDRELYLLVTQDSGGDLCTCGAFYVRKNRTVYIAAALRAITDRISEFYPEAVYTDDSDAEQNAILEVFPRAVLRLCAWHKSRNLVTNLVRYLGRDTTDKVHYLFWQCVMAPLTPAGCTRILESVTAILDILHASEATVEGVLAGFRGNFLHFQVVLRRCPVLRRLTSMLRVCADAMLPSEVTVEFAKRQPHRNLFCQCGHGIEHSRNC